MKLFLSLGLVAGVSAAALHVHDESSATEHADAQAQIHAYGVPFLGEHDDSSSGSVQTSSTSSTSSVSSSSSLQSSRDEDADDNGEVRADVHAKGDNEFDL